MCVCIAIKYTVMNDDDDDVSPFLHVLIHERSEHTVFVIIIIRF